MFACLRRQGNGESEAPSARRGDHQRVIITTLTRGMVPTWPKVRISAALVEAYDFSMTIRGEGH